eukprot:scaffold244_cov126-Skeletonema_dohrnii-CCMP3373.AAC.6
MDKNKPFQNVAQSNSNYRELTNLRSTIEIDNCAWDKVESDQATTGREKHRYMQAQASISKRGGR